MRHIPILILAVATLCAEDGPPAGQKPPKPNQEAIKAALEKAFTAGDADSSGKLTRTEFGVAAEAFHAAMQAAREKEKGADGSTTKKPAKPAPPAEALDKAFTTGDANSDAGLDAAEFAVAIKALRPPRGDKGDKGGDAPPPPKE